MARTCRDICRDYVCEKIQNGAKYKFCKRCTFCEMFLKTSEIRCPCCKVILRTKPRSRKNYEEAVLA